MNYDEAFDATLRPRHDLLSFGEIESAGQRRQGRLLPEDPECWATVDAFKLHRAHTDAFRLAIEERAPFLEQGQAVCVVDLGAGRAALRRRDGASGWRTWRASGYRTSYIGL